MVRHYAVMELESLSRKDASTASSSSRDAPPSGLDASEKGKLRKNAAYRREHDGRNAEG